jgi:hypothetical protein
MQLQKALIQLAEQKGCPYTLDQLTKAAASQQDEAPEIEKVKQWLPIQLASLVTTVETVEPDESEPIQPAQKVAAKTRRKKTS